MTVYNVEYFQFLNERLNQVGVLSTVEGKGWRIVPIPTEETRIIQIITTNTVVVGADTIASAEVMKDTRNVLGLMIPKTWKHDVMGVLAAVILLTLVNFEYFDLEIPVVAAFVFPTLIHHPWDDSVLVVFEFAWAEMSLLDGIVAVLPVCGDTGSCRMVIMLVCWFSDFDIPELRSIPRKGGGDDANAFTALGANTDMDHDATHEERDATHCSWFKNLVLHEWSGCAAVYKDAPQWEHSNFRVGLLRGTLRRSDKVYCDATNVRC